MPWGACGWWQCWFCLRAAHCWWCLCLWRTIPLVFTAIAALGVLLYLYAFTGHTTRGQDARECESQIKGENTGINDWVSFTSHFFVIASRSIFLFSVLSIFIPIFYITVINGKPKCIELGTLPCILRWGCPPPYGWCTIG